MKNPVKQSLITAIALAGLSAFPLLAMPPDADGGTDMEERGEARMEQRMQRMEQQLNLTPEQKKQLQAHRETHRAEARRLRQGLAEKRKALRQELEKTDMSQENAKRIHEEMKALQSQLADHRFQGILAVRKILTPEQFRRMHELREAHPGRGYGRGKGEGMGGPEGPGAGQKN